jgi:hypothetical protein
MFATVFTSANTRFERGIGVLLPRMQHHRAARSVTLLCRPDGENL